MVAGFERGRFGNFAGERGDGRRLVGRAKMAAEIESNQSPPNPLRVCHEIGKRLRPNDIVIGDGGDFVATAAYVLPLEWPQLWMGLSRRESLY